MREDVLVSGSVRIIREEREEGPVIRVFVPGGAQALKFDCFKRGAHYHLDPDGRNRVYAIADADSLGWAAQAIRERLGQLPRSAGYQKVADELDDAVRSQLAKIDLAAHL